MNRKIQITTKAYPDIRLRAIALSDQEELRNWKNTNRTSFFYQEMIQPDQQRKWFEGYLDRDNDYMFLVEEMTESVGCHKIGCLAFRLEDDGQIDLYNIIRGQKSIGSASMKKAMYLMLAYIAERYPEQKIKCDVLKGNPAVKWYHQCGFAILQEKEYYVMEIDRKKIPALQIMVREEE